MGILTKEKLEKFEKPCINCRNNTGKKYCRIGWTIALKKFYCKSWIKKV